MFPILGIMVVLRRPMSLPAMPLGFQRTLSGRTRALASGSDRDKALIYDRFCRVFTIGCWGCVYLGRWLGPDEHPGSGCPPFIAFLEVRTIPRHAGLFRMGMQAKITYMDLLAHALGVNGIHLPCLTCLG